MSEDSSTPRRSWLGRLSDALLGEPKHREDLRSWLRDARTQELLGADALEMIEGVLEVSEMRVCDVMVPRSQMDVIERDWSLPRILQEIIDSGHSRFPVIGDSRDEVLGILIAKDLLYHFAQGGEFELNKLLRPAHCIPETKRLDALLSEFRGNRLHMAIAIDEYGGVAGLVTIEDVLEQIVGEIDDEYDQGEDNIRKFSETHYTVQALTPVEDFNEYFGTQFDEDKADTIGGLLIVEAGHLPKRNELVPLGPYQFRVLRADHRRLQLLELRLSPPNHEITLSASGV